MKYKDLLVYANNNHKVKEYEEDAIYFLIEEEENISRSTLLLKLNENVKNESNIIKKIDMYIKDGIPVQYIVGYANFYGLKFKVNKDVLIPRFDSEVVIENALIEINKFTKSDLSIVDIGCGSGCLAITLYKNLEGKYNIFMDGIDISKEALNVSIENADTIGAKINFMQNDLLDNINKKYDVIISNPPYIEKYEYVWEIVKNNEPALALFSEDEGMYHYKKILDQSVDRLENNGVIIFEIPDNKCDKIIEYASKYYKNITYKKDYNDNRRVLIIRKD